MLGAALLNVKDPQIESADLDKVVRGQNIGEIEVKCPQ